MGVMLCEMTKTSPDGAEQTESYSAAWAEVISRSNACFRSFACSSVLVRTLKDTGVLFSYPTNETAVFVNEGFRLPCIRKFCREDDKKERSGRTPYTDNKDSACVAIPH